MIHATMTTHEDCASVTVIDITNIGTPGWHGTFYDDDLTKFKDGILSQRRADSLTVHLSGYGFEFDESEMDEFISCLDDCIRAIKAGERVRKTMLPEYPL